MSYLLRRTKSYSGTDLDEVSRLSGVSLKYFVRTYKIDTQIGKHLVTKDFNLKSK